MVKCCSRRRPRWSSLMRYSCLAMILEAFACSQRADPCRKVRSVARLLPPTLSANSIQKMKRQLISFFAFCHFLHISIAGGINTIKNFAYHLT